jgi:Ribbon-helix-helix protein, copG family
MARSTTISPEEDAQITALAKAESKSKSAVVREAVRVYRISRDLDRIREIGRRTAAAMNIETYEDIERIAS